MADYRQVIPFIKTAEGGLSKNPADNASKDPVPDGSGYHTNKGITWTAWKSFFGTDATSIQRFYAMSDDDWGVVFKKGYWDKVCGDQINSQTVANILADWCWGSGTFYPSEMLQTILRDHFGDKLGVDGDIGTTTLADINSAPETDLIQQLTQKHIAFVNQIVVNNPTQSEFLQGWLNRINNLTSFDVKNNDVV